jgi:hypothetical protein
LFGKQGLDVAPVALADELKAPAPLVGRRRGDRTL